MAVSVLLFLMVSVWMLAPLFTRVHWMRLAGGLPESREEMENPGLFMLQREICWNESLILLSDHDSFQLALNLVDSTMSLYLKGVPVYRIPVARYRIDPLLKILPGPIYLQFFNHPLPVSGRTATIVKEPIVIREAPRDPEEAEISAWAPDTLVQNPAFFRLEMAYGIDLFVLQDQHNGIRDKRVGSCFLAGLKLKDGMRFWKYRPSITVRIPPDDVRAFYRAFPEGMEVSVSYPLKQKHSDET